MSSLLLDSAANILAALPVKDLFRFRCVSSSFCSLINSPYFTKLHLSHSEKTRSGYLFIYRRYADRLDEIESVHFDSLEDGPQIYPPPIPPNVKGTTDIVASCNGVVVLRTGNGAPSLWNPFTRKFRQLPSCEVTDQKPGHSRTRLVHGLGYDNKTDDYKLVQLDYFRCFSNNPNISKVVVFCFKTDTWREIECPPSVSFNELATMDRGCFVNNALHWVRYVEVDSKILGFILVKEEFYLVPHPDFDLAVTALVVLGGCLALVINIPDCDSSVDVWVMKDYGVKESWSRLLFLYESRYSQFGLPSIGATPIAYSRDGKKILLNIGSNLSWYDFTTESVDIVNVLDYAHRIPPDMLDYFLFDSTLFMESLVAFDR